MKFTKREWEVKPEPLSDWELELVDLGIPRGEEEPKRYLTRILTLGKFYIKWVEALNDTDKRSSYTRIQWCIPCGHVSVYHGQGYATKSWSSIKYAFGKPKYTGDCRHLNFNLPIKLANKWFGIEASYKTKSPWDKPGFKENR